MAEEANIHEVAEELRNANEENLKELIESWYERTHTDGLRVGAKMISAAVYDEMKKNLKKGKDSSLRDYQRCVEGILKIISVQLVKRDNTEETSDNQEG